MNENRLTVIAIGVMVLAAIIFAADYHGRQVGAATVREQEIAPLRKQIDSLRVPVKAAAARVDTAVAKAKVADSNATAMVQRARAIHDTVRAIDSVHVEVHDTIAVVPVEVTNRFTRDSVAMLALQQAQDAERIARIELMVKDTASQRLIAAQDTLNARLTEALNRAQAVPSWKVGVVAVGVLGTAFEVAKHVHLFGLK